MHHAITQEELFQQILEAHAHEPLTTAQIRILCERAGLFDGDARVINADARVKDAIIRGLARQKGWTDKDGNPIELFNVVQVNPKTSKEEHVYLNLEIATFDHHVYLVKDRLSKADYFREEAKNIYTHGCKKFGRKFQRLFQFD